MSQCSMRGVVAVDPQEHVPYDRGETSPLGMGLAEDSPRNDSIRLGRGVV